MHMLLIESSSSSSYSPFTIPIFIPRSLPAFVEAPHPAAVNLSFRKYFDLHMACQVILHSWTLSGLVGAFLDLAIAYLLLCCSAVSFVIAKFLAVFGLSLPCPCNGLFGYPSHGPCVQRFSVDWPTEAVSSVQLSVKSKFPFDAILGKNDHCQLNLKLIRERKLDDGGLELEGEASYSSFSDPRRSLHSLSGSDSIGKFDLKGKGTASQRNRCGFRRRRRGSIDCGKLSTASSYDHMRSDVHVVHHSPSEPSKIGSRLNAHNLMPLSLHDVQDTSVVSEKSLPDFEANENDVTTKDELLYDNITSFENPKNCVGRKHGLDSQDGSAVRILEQALEEEQAARAALCSELEEERIAAATAADEAMAMISRLQEEKASVEIEARQYQRILEEKSAYDAEEMDILKEIIVRREREKHFLEKEVESYRKLFQENEGLESQIDYTEEQNNSSFLESSVDPMMILQQLSECIDKRGNVQKKGNHPDYLSASFEKHSSAVSADKGSSDLEYSNDANIVKGLDNLEYSNIIQDHLRVGYETGQDIQEKGVLSMDDIPYPQLCKQNSSLGHGLKDNQIGEQMFGEEVYPHRAIKADGEKEFAMQETEPLVNDVYIIDPKCNTWNKSTEKRVEPLVMNHNNCDNSASNSLMAEDSANNSLRGESDINRSCSDTVDRFPALSRSSSRSSVPALRRDSLSALDQERLKIDNEIAWLRERLRAVQEEKEKLKNSLEFPERGKSELQLLEDIASQLREIRHFTEPEKASRQASLPPLSSKGKKRRSRSSSADVGQSVST